MIPSPTVHSPRILIITQHFWPSVGGAEVMLRRLAAAWSSAGATVAVLTEQAAAASPLLEALDGFQIYRTPKKSIRFLGTLSYMAGVRRFIRSAEGRFDLIYVSMLKHAAYAALTIRCSPPIILRAEGAGPTGDAHWQDSALGGSMIAKACRAAPAVVAPSQEIQEELLARGYRADRLQVIPNGVPIPQKPWSASSVSAARRQLGLREAKTVVYTGRLHAGKGLADLLEATARTPEIQTVLVGDGPERAVLESQTRRLGSADRVHFAGQVEDVEPWLRAGDLYVLPSYQEGLSVALLEALCLGMPTLASNIPGNRGLLPTELLPLFPIHHPTQLSAMIQAVIGQAPQSSASPRFGPLNRQRQIAAEKFSVSAVAARHLELFGKIDQAG